ncbi:MAG: tRNA epoxyqueuosine(34) reductase QueG [Alicyclobacillus sp.]|nr:tRNA epoxyqueuosine(34) reductase QueG [Alicyclobacillus sp.]
MTRARGSAGSVSREAEGREGHAVSREVLARMGRAAGFAAIGATTADPFPELVPRLRAYENRGRTGFEHAEIERRIDPKRWYPEAVSLIAVATPYLTEEGFHTARRHPRQGLHGAVTVYAYGADYHTVMAERARALVQLLEAHVGGRVGYRIAVDTAPLVDRRVAERAGIGWVGKNCMLFTPEHGSFVFLGTIAVDIAIEPTGPEQPSRCGTCTRCLDACPTGALLAPGVIDATRCLSYVTQMKGVIPREFRAAMGRRVWGCDTCQWACPENRDVSFAKDAAFLPEGELAYPELVEILQWSNRGFTARYGHTAAAWRGVRTWQRNALIALGNTRKAEAVPHIAPFLRHDRVELRISAAWALGRIGGLAASRHLTEALQEEEDPACREELELALREAARSDATRS